ncbi:hypothetical protein [Halovenus halobia]|uniref:hypothetical protein n=1 Tax=Halovenus halobia TaxID=3396622 RepID=UPI003F56FEF7
MDRSRQLLLALFYVSAIGLAGTVSIPDPTSPLAPVPAVAGIVVVAHAAWSGQLNAVGYAVVAMWAAVLTLSVGAGLLTVTTEFGDGFVPIAENRSARLAATGGLCLVPVTTYAYFLKN